MQLSMGLVHVEAARAAAEKLADSDHKNVLLERLGVIEEVIDDPCKNSNENVSRINSMIEDAEVVVSGIGPNDQTKAIVVQLNLLETIVKIYADSIPEVAEVKGSVAVGTVNNGTIEVELDKALVDEQNLKERLYGAYWAALEEGYCTKFDIGQNKAILVLYAGEIL